MLRLTVLHHFFSLGSNLYGKIFFDYFFFFFFAFILLEESIKEIPCYEEEQSVPSV